MFCVVRLLYCLIVVWMIGCYWMICVLLFVVGCGFAFARWVFVVCFPCVCSVLLVCCLYV